MSNNKEFREYIRAKEENMVSKTSMGEQSDESSAKSSICVSKESSIHRVLGLEWNYDQDTVLFNLRSVANKTKVMEPAKCVVLSALSGIFVPLRLLSSWSK